MTGGGGRQPHVLFVNEFYWPDICASAAVLTDHLPELARLRPDWRFSVLAGDRAWDRAEQRWPARERHGAIDVFRAPRGAVRRSLPGRAWGFARFHRAAIQLGRSLDRVDIVVASTAPPLGGRIGRAIARAHGAALVYKVLDLYPDCAESLGVLRRGGAVARAWRRVDTALMRDAAAVVVISQRMAERVVATRGVDATRVHHIADGIDPARVVPRDAGTLRKQWGLSDRFVVQYAGNMGLSHPFDTILAAAERLAAFPDVVFQFVGAGPGRRLITEAAARLGPSIRIFDMLPADQLGDLLGVADVCLVSQHPALFDQALPHKAYAALAAGRPLVFVGDRRSEVADWLSRHDCGSQVDPGDVDGLATALLSWKDERDRAAAGQRGQAFIRSGLTHAHAAAHWRAVLESILLK